MSVALAIAKFQEKVVITTDREFRGRVVAIAKQAIINTPADTGRLRGNWQIGFGDRPTGNPYHVNDSVSDSGQAANKANAAVARKANSGKGKTVAYVTNNVPYAIPVEAGGPTNRPRRMLARAIMKQTRLV